MTEEIIIDGIDVGGCSLLNKKIKVCMYSRETCNGICDYGCYARNEIIDRLEQENKSYKQQHNDDTEEIAKLGLDVAILEQENKEIYENGQIEITKLCNEKTKYRSALDTIQKMVLSAWEQGKYLDGGLYNDLTNEFAKINEVLQ